MKRRPFLFGGLAAALALPARRPALAALPAALPALPALFDGVVALDGQITPGGLVRGRTVPGSVLRLDGKPLAIDRDGAFLFGLARDHAASPRLEVTRPGQAPVAAELTLVRRQWQIQHVNGLPPRTVNPDPAELARIRREQVLIDAARRGGLDQTGYAQAFQWPAIAIISGVYGSQRILNGEPRAPHLGVDIAAATGSPIHAPADGIVTLAEPDLFFTGGTVILAHGLGLTTLYAHQSTLAVKAGQRLRQGEVIGQVGRTGRATGPHLHWGMNWFAMALDAALVVPPMPAVPVAGPVAAVAAAKPRP